MSKRNYNVFFNTHTVSGIVISVALYVIFLAGAFALFKEEIEIWEQGTHTKNIARKNIDFDFLLKKLSEEHHLTSRDIRFNLGHDSDDAIYVQMLVPQDTVGLTDEAKKFAYTSIDVESGKTATYQEKYSLGEFIYRLHFFSQIPFVGIYLAGFVSVFFLFAIVTGVIVHWKKIISNFYQFNPKLVLKRVWTDAHTALGVIGLPFQFMFAVTGAYFGLSILVLIPANFLYNGDQNKLMEDLRPDRKVYEWVAKSDKVAPSVNDFVLSNSDRWENFNPHYLVIKNYGGTNMRYRLMGELSDDQRFLSSGSVSLEVATGKTIVHRNPNEAKYSDDIQLSMGRLHFASFGGVAMKVVYFILALITCFVIITGVLIWIEARNKKSMSLKQRLYTTKVGHIYLGICLSLYPVIALFFIIVKLLPEAYQTQKMSILYTWFFLVWLLATIFFRYKRNNYFTNKVTLLFGAVLGFLIPIVNGIVSDNWLWKTYQAGQYEILTVDLLWIFLSAIAFIVYLKIKPSVQEQSAFAKHPIDYKNRKKLLKEEADKLAQKSEIPTEKLEDENHIPMRTKIVILWIFLGIGWIVHHMYGLFNIYYNETLIMEGANGHAPLIHHIYRIIFEGLCLFFGLLTLEVSKKWFKLLSFIWAIIAGLYNVYHFITAMIFESGNISEIFMLLLVSIASIFLIQNINKWKKITT